MLSLFLFCLTCPALICRAFIHKKNIIKMEIFKDRNGIEYKKGDTLIFKKIDDLANGETCTIIEINDISTALKWKDNTITYEFTTWLIDYFTHT